MRLNIKIKLPIIVIFLFFIISFPYRIAISTTASTGTPATTPNSSQQSIMNDIIGGDFIASTFQTNASQQISNIETSTQTYLQTKEVDGINFGLHLVDFQGDTITDPKIQFFKDYIRISCNSQYESNATDCHTLDATTVYGHLRSMNIFDLNPTTVELRLAETVARTMINPFPDPKLNTLFNDKHSFEDPSKQQTAANLIAAQAPLTLANNTFNEIIAKRTAYDIQGQQVSMMQLIHNESVRRLSSTWMENTKSLPLKHLILELLQIEAFKMWMEYNKFTQNERIEALLATLLSVQANNMQKLTSSLEDSTSSSNKMAEEAQKKLPTSTIDPKTGKPL